MSRDLITNIKTSESQTITVTDFLSTKDYLTNAYKPLLIINNKKLIAGFMSLKYLKLENLFMKRLRTNDLSYEIPGFKEKSIVKAKTKLRNYSSPKNNTLLVGISNKKSNNRNSTDTRGHLVKPLGVYLLYEEIPAKVYIPKFKNGIELIIDSDISFKY